MNARYCLVAVALALAACGQSTAPSSSAGGGEISEPAEDSTTHTASLPEVDPALRAAPNADFTAIEPTEVGISGAPSVMEALEPLLGPELSEGATLSVSIAAQQNNATADVVRQNLADDSVSAGQVRIEFRREPDGWYPTNAYRRSQCARGALAGQWTKELCP